MQFNLEKYPGVSSGIVNLLKEFAETSNPTPNKVDENLLGLAGKTFKDFKANNKPKAIEFARRLEEIVLHGAGIANKYKPKAKTALDSSSDIKVVTVAPKDSIDTIFGVVQGIVQSLYISKGGMGANFAEVLGKLGQAPAYIPRFGNGPIADLQKRSLEAAGIDTGNLFEVENDAFIHPCFELGLGQPFWFVPSRLPLNQEQEAGFLEKIIQSIKDNSSKILVLSNGDTSKEFATKLTKKAIDEGAFVVCNTNQYDITHGSDTELYKSKNLGMVKPNEQEFVQILHAAGILDSAEDASNMLQRLQKNAEKGRFQLHAELAGKLIDQGKVKLVLLSLGKEGAIFANKKFAIHAKPPEIDLKCASGAGDTGLAAFIAFLLERNIDPINISNKDDMQALLKRFLAGGAATAALAGNNLADKGSIDGLLRGWNPEFQELNNKKSIHAFS